METSSFWRTVRHWLHRKLSFWHPVQPVAKISSKDRHLGSVYTFRVVSDEQIVRMISTFQWYTYTYILSLVRWGCFTLCAMMCELFLYWANIIWWRVCNERLEMWLQLPVFVRAKADNRVSGGHLQNHGFLRQAYPGINAEIIYSQGPFY